MFPHLIAFFTLLAPALLGPARLSHIAAPATPADSVSILLFSIPAVRTVQITNARDVATDSRRTPISKFEATAARDGAVAAAQLTGRRVLVRPGRGPLSLEVDSRRRTVPGPVTITSSGGMLRLVARIPMQEYLAGALAAESQSRDPLQYRIALSVLQRNYTRVHRGRHAPDADLCDNSHCQLFRGTGVGARERSIVDAAEQLRAHFSSYPCYYSACCGGGTLVPEDVWGLREGGYARVACDLCSGSQWFRWRSSIASGPVADRELAALPGAPFVDEEAKIRLGRALGWRLVPSNTIERVERRGNRWILEGRGFGHRVGLCQEGARQLALRGRSAAEILSHYFPGTP